MDKERRRPSIDQRLRRITSNGRSPSKKDVMDRELGNCGLLDKNGFLHKEDLPTAEKLQATEKSPLQEIEAEIGISVDVLEVFAEEQNRVPRTNGHALLDDQFPSCNPDSPRSIISDDYSEDSRP